MLLHIANVALKFAPDLEPWAINSRPALSRERMSCPTGRAWSATAESRPVEDPGPIGSAPMNNPLRILQTLDRHLARPTEITLFGRAALALGFADSLPHFATTRDVDAILPVSWLAAEDQNLDMDDIRFLLQQDQISVHDLQAAFAQARVPDVAEIRELFRAAQPKVLALANGRSLRQQTILSLAGLKTPRLPREVAPSPQTA